MATEVVPFPTQDEPIVKRSGDDFVAVWPQSYPYLTMRFRSPYEDKAGVYAELGVSINIAGFPKRPEWGKLNMMASQTRAQVANRLSEQWAGPGAPPFRSLLTDACAAVVDVVREGEPYEVISREREVTKPYFTLDPMLPENRITTLFGDGSTGKGLLSLCACLSVQEGESLLGMDPTPGNALYLDYEADSDEQIFRTARLAEGFGLTSWRDIHYRRLFQPLHNEATGLRRFIDDNNINLVVVDSLGAAIGANLNDGFEIIRAFAVMRSFRCTVLAVDHVSKGESDGRPTGSNYKFHYSRAIWETKKATEAGVSEMRIALLNHKANNAELSQPLGFHISFDGREGPITMRRFDVRGDEHLGGSATVSSRILYFLRAQPASFAELMDQLKIATPDIKENTVTQSLKRLRAGNRVTVGAGGRYGLLAAER